MDWLWPVASPDVVAVSDKRDKDWPSPVEHPQHLSAHKRAQEARMNTGA